MATTRRIGEFHADAYMAAKDAYYALAALPEGQTDEQVLDCVRGIGYDAFRILDEKPGLFGAYHKVDAWRHLRSLRNNHECPLFDIISEVTP